MAGLKPSVDGRKLRIGIIGVGGRGLLSFGELLNVRDDVEIAALVDPNPMRLKAACEMLGISPSCHSSVEAMIDESSVDGVILASPDHAHEANALAAIEAGLHILVDKPLATTAAGCMRIIRAGRERDVEVAVGFNLRHVPLLARIKELIDAGEIGNLMLIENSEFYLAECSYNKTISTFLNPSASPRDERNGPMVDCSYNKIGHARPDVESTKRSMPSQRKGQLRSCKSLLVLPIVARQLHPLDNEDTAPLPSRIFRVLRYPGRHLYNGTTISFVWHYITHARAVPDEYDSRLLSRLVGHQWSKLKLRPARCSPKTALHFAFI